MEIKIQVTIFEEDEYGKVLQNSKVKLFKTYDSMVVPHEGDNIVETVFPKGYAEVKKVFIDYAKGKCLIYMHNLKAAEDTISEVIRFEANGWRRK